MHALDLGIIIGYLFLTLMIGLYQGRKVKSMKDYAIADRNYATPVLIATISATLIGGGSTLGVVEKVSVVGIIYLLLFVGDPVSKVVISRFIAPRMSQFKDEISIGDMMEKFYGRGGKILTGLAGTILSVGLLGAQVTALGTMFHFFLGLSHLWGVIIGFGIVVIYSSFGGIKAVTLTDVIQFGVLVVAIPMICNIGLNMTGGYINLFQSVPTTHISLTPVDGSFYKYLAIAFVFCFPLLTPSVAQRLLMAKDTSQIQKSFMFSALLDIPLYFTVGIIGLIALALYPDALPSSVFPHLINDILPVGIKGLAIVGLIAVIMSTCDSYLNSASISLVHDTLKPILGEKISKHELLYSKLVTFTLGTLSIIIAAQYKAVMDIVVYSFNVWVPIVVIPLYFGLFKGKSAPQCFYVSALVGITTNILWGFSSLENLVGIDGLFPSMVMNGIAFWLCRTYLFKADFTSAEESPTQGLEGALPLPKLNLSYFETLPTQFFSNLLKRLEEYQPPYVLFGAFALINFIFPYFMWSYTENFYVTSALRFIAGALAFGLVIKDYWTEKMKQYLGIYWFVTLLYCLPFLTTYMLQENQGSYNWVLNSSLTLFLLSVLVDWRSFLTILGLGIPLGIGAYILSHGPVNIRLEQETLFWVFYTCLFSVTIGLTFTRKKELLITQRQQTLKSAAGAIAHEMRTPLMNVSLVGANVDLNVERIEKIVAAHPELKQAFQEPLEKLAAQGEGLEEIAKGANILINTLLTNLKQDLDKLPQTEMSMKETLEEVLEGYSFQPHEMGMVRTDIQADFTFRGNKELITHIFYNLLKNSIYFVKAARKGDILITVQENKVVFKDTGTGVEKHRLKHLFTPFYSRRSHGTGIGLAFCKRAMESMGGTITVASELNEHTTFTLEFPHGEI